MQLVVPSSIYRVTTAMDASVEVKMPLGEAQQLLSHTIIWLIVHACLHPTSWGWQCFSMGCMLACANAFLWIMCQWFSPQCTNSNRENKGNKQKFQKSLLQNIVVTLHNGLWNLSLPSAKFSYNSSLDKSIVHTRTTSNYLWKKSKTSFKLSGTINFQLMHISNG